MSAVYCYPLEVNTDKICDDTLDTEMLTAEQSINLNQTIKYLGEQANLTNNNVDLIGNPFKTNCTPRDAPCDKLFHYWLHFEMCDFLFLITFSLLKLVGNSAL